MFFLIVQNLRSQQVVTNYPPVDTSFLSGAIIDESAIPETIRVQGMFRADAPPSHFQLGKIPIFSTQFVEALRSGGVDNIQVFPAVIVGDDGTEWSNYHAVQIVGLVRCADLEKSDCQIIARAVDESSPPLCIFDELEIDPQKVPAGFRIFRLAEQPSWILINEPLLDLLLDSAPDTDIGWGFMFNQVCDSAASAKASVTSP